MRTPFRREPDQLSEPQETFGGEEARAVALSFETLKVALASGEVALANNMAQRFIVRRRARELAEVNLARTVFGSRITVKGERDLIYLNTGANLLLAHELRSIEFANEHGLDHSEENHNLGPEFISSIRSVISSTDPLIKRATGSLK